MGDMREGFDYLKELRKEKKEDNYQKNMLIINESNIEYKQDQNMTVLIKTKEGTLCFYPTTNKFMVKNKVRGGDAKSMLGFIKNMDRINLNFNKRDKTNGN